MTLTTDRTDTYMAFQLGVAFAYLRNQHGRAFSDRQRADISEADRRYQDGRVDVSKQLMDQIERIVRGERA